jgi:hypothetical protein
MSAFRPEADLTSRLADVRFESLADTHVGSRAQGLIRETWSADPQELANPKAQQHDLESIGHRSWGLFTWVEIGHMVIGSVR